MRYALKVLFKKILRLTPQYMIFKKKCNLSLPGNLGEVLNYSIKHVPYYMQKYGKAFSKSNPKIEDFDFLEKKDIAGNELSFVSNTKIKPLLFKYATGGTTNISLNLVSDMNFKIFVLFARDYVFSKIGIDSGLKVAVLRGQKPRSGLHEYSSGELILSSYDISMQTVKQYMELLCKYGINCIHAYPSSLTILCRCISAYGDGLPVQNIRGILTSSETITREEKELILKTFPGAKLVDFYGLNEESAIAYSVDMGYYQFLDGFSHVELIESGEVTRNGKLCEIVGTSYRNKCMPFIRYKTGDFAEVDDNGNVLSIVGRSQDKIFNKDSDLVPCIVLTRPGSFANIQAFQYIQRAVGQIEFLVVPTAGFGKKDELAITEDIETSFGNKVSVNIKVVSELTRLPNGKQPRLVQLLDINK